MLEQGKRYTAKDILFIADVPTGEKDFWKKDIIIGGISIKDKGHLIKVQMVNQLLIQIGNKSYKAKVKPAEVQE